MEFYDISLTTNMNTINAYKEQLKELRWWEFGKRKHAKYMIKSTEESNDWELSYHGLKVGYVPKSESLNYSDTKKILNSNITYKLVTHTATTQSGIQCLVCGMTSYHPKDIEHKYCGNCHDYHPIKIG